MLYFARGKHPNEIVLLLRGEADGGEVIIEEFLLPPFGTSGRGFAAFRPHMLPIDFSIVGTSHSHPSGSTRPSPTDLNHFYARVMLIVAYPYMDECVAAYNSKGEALLLQIKG
jgi:proteasome lid subunit RPN8/RPN11